MNKILIFILIIFVYLELIKFDKVREHFHYLYPNNLINRLYPLYVGVHRYLRDTPHYNQQYYYNSYLNRYYRYNPLTEERDYTYGYLPSFLYPFYKTSVTYRREYV